MPRKGILGSGSYAIVTSSDTLSPDHFVHNIANELIDSNITRNAVDTNKTVKTIVKGQHVRNKYTIINPTTAIINLYLAEIGNTVRLIPHTDNPGFSYFCLIQEIELDDTDPKRIFLSTDLISREYTDPNTHIEVLYPSDTGIAFTRGVGAPTYNITWSSLGFTGNVDIELWKGGVYDSDIVLGTSNDGTYTWTIPITQTLGTDYKVKIIASGNEFIYDLSDNNFRINTYVP